MLWTLKVKKVFVVSKKMVLYCKNCQITITADQTYLQIKIKKKQFHAWKATDCKPEIKKKTRAN